MPDLHLNPTAPIPEAARLAGLSYVYDTEPGITRKRSGKSFAYYRDSVKLVDEADIARIKKLAIPPAWRDVWICPDCNGHIQATGLDDRGRKQYKYHTAWREKRDENKFSNMVAFGHALPSLRRKILTALNGDDLSRDKVIAAVIRLLDKTGLRIGNDSYTAENHTYGLTTIRKKHLDLHNSEIAFDFPAKGGKVFKGSITDAKVAKVIAQCEDLPGYRLFKYRDDNGVLHDIGSADINAWLRSNTAENVSITAKDFRTWHACVLFLEDALRHCAEGQNFNLKPILTSVSQQLGNTPAILKKSYVHPELVDLYRTGCLLNKEWDAGNITAPVTGLSKIENLLLAWLERKAI